MERSSDQKIVQGMIMGFIQSKKGAEAMMYLQDDDDDVLTRCMMMIIQGNLLKPSRLSSRPRRLLTKIL